MKNPAAAAHIKYQFSKWPFLFEPTILFFFLLIAALASTVSAQQRAAQSQRAPSAADLITGLQSRTPSDREQAAKAAAEIKPLTLAVAPVLINSFRGLESQRKIDSAAARLIGQEQDLYFKNLATALANTGSPVIPQLSLALGDPDIAVRRGAVDALLLMEKESPAVWPVLISAFGNTHDDVPSRIEEKINRTGPSAIPYLERGLRDGNPKIRGGSAVALSYILQVSAQVNGPPLGTSQEGTVYEWPYWKGVPPTAVILEVAQALSSVERSKLNQTLFNLYGVGPPVRVALPYVLPWLKDSDVGIRTSALWCLAAMGPDAKPAVTNVIQCLRDPMPPARLKAMEVLGNIGPAAKAAIPQLASTLTGDDSDAAQQAALALAKIDPSYAGVLPAVMKMLEDPQQKQSAIGALGAMGSRARVARPALEQLATHVVPDNPDDTEDHVVERAAAVTALSRIEGAEAIPVLMRVIDNDPDDAVRGAAISALSDMAASKPRAIKALVVAFDNDSQPMREAAGAALVKLGPAAVPALIEGLKSPHLYERAWAVETLSQIKPLPDDVTRELKIALGDKSTIIRNEVADALKGVTVDANAEIRDEASTDGDSDCRASRRGRKHSAQRRPRPAERKTLQHGEHRRPDSGGCES